MRGDSHGVENIVKIVFYEISGSGPGLASLENAEETLSQCK